MIKMFGTMTDQLSIKFDSIDNAPKNKTLLLHCPFGDYEFCVGHYSFIKNKWITENNFNCNPTHYALLPKVEI